MMRTLGILMAIKPFLSATANWWSTYNDPLCDGKQYCTFFFANDRPDDGTDFHKFVACIAAYTTTCRCKWSLWRPSHLHSPFYVEH
jgi:uncharacterized cysteine cluster protein YcgN (CxxCxxCC family)